MRILGIFLLTVFMSGCVSNGGETIRDFSDRSVGYGWLDIDDVDANRLHSVTVFQYLPRTDKPYYYVRVKEFEGGFLYYTFAFPEGAFGLYSAEGQKCLGILCGQTLYSYDFGKQGSGPAKVRIDQPGIYNFGSYRLQEVDTGFFEQGKFEVIPTDRGPSDQQMLEEMLKDAQDKPQIDARIRAALRAKQI